MNTELNYMRSLRAAVGTPRSLCPGTQRQRKLRRWKPTASVLYGVWVERDACLMYCWNHYFVSLGTPTNYNTLP